MADESVVVRDSVAWTLGRICEIIPQVVLENNLQNLVGTLLNQLDAEPRVAANVCWVSPWVGVLLHISYIGTGMCCCEGKDY